MKPTYLDVMKVNGMQDHFEDAKSWIIHFDHRFGINVLTYSPHMYIRVKDINNIYLDLFNKFKVDEF